MLWYLDSSFSTGRSSPACWSGSEPVGEQAGERLFELAQMGYVYYTYTSVDRWMWAPEVGMSIHTHYDTWAIPNTHTDTHTRSGGSIPRTIWT